MLLACMLHNGFADAKLEALETQKRESIYVEISSASIEQHSTEKFLTSLLNFHQLKTYNRVQNWQPQRWKTE